MSGIEREQSNASLLRNAGAVVEAGAQGNGGAPFFFTKNYGVLIDSNGGRFDVNGNTVRFAGDSRKDIEYFVMLGQPMEVISSLSMITGRPSMPPKWALGFMNGQWGTTETMVKSIVETYREKHMPLDAFILDFDWKAWGEDDYGEWRWNSTASPGNYDPDKYPDGASGVFAQQMLNQGVKLVGILKPRILLFKTHSSV